MKLNKLLRGSFEAYRKALLSGHSSRVSAATARTGQAARQARDEPHDMGTRPFHANPPQGRQRLARTIQCHRFLRVQTSSLAIQIPAIATIEPAKTSTRW